MLPEKFQQIYIRLYWKGSKSDGTENKQKIRHEFSKIKGKKRLIINLNLGMHFQ